MFSLLFGAGLKMPIGCNYIETNKPSLYFFTVCYRILRYFFFLFRWVGMDSDIRSECEKFRLTDCAGVAPPNLVRPEKSRVVSVHVHLNSCYCCDYYYFAISRPPLPLTHFPLAPPLLRRSAAPLGSAPVSAAFWIASGFSGWTKTGEEIRRFAKIQIYGDRKSRTENYRRKKRKKKKKAKKQNSETRTQWGTKTERRLNKNTP